MKMENMPLVEMPFEDYHANPAFGHTDLVRMLRSPAHYRELKDNPKEPTPAFFFGRALHAALLEPRVFAEKYAAINEEHLLGALQSMDDYKVAAKELGIAYSKLKKDELAEAIRAADTEKRFRFREDVFAELYSGKTLLKEEEIAMIEAMLASTRQHAGAVKLLAAGHAELSAFWKDDETGVACKCRPDFLAVDSAGEIIACVDVKTTTDASLRGFSKSVASYGYDIQAAFYTDGLRETLGKQLPFIFVAIEKDAPHLTGVYQADQDMIEVGRKKYRTGLALARYCQDHNVWPGYQPNGEIEMISLPRWAMAEASDYDLTE